MLPNTPPVTPPVTILAIAQVLAAVIGTAMQVTTKEIPQEDMFQCRQNVSCVTVKGLALPSILTSKMTIAVQATAVQDMPLLVIHVLANLMD